MWQWRSLIDAVNWQQAPDRRADPPLAEMPQARTTVSCPVCVAQWTKSFSTASRAQASGVSVELVNRCEVPAGLVGDDLQLVQDSMEGLMSICALHSTRRMFRNVENPEPGTKWRRAVVDGNR